MSHIAGTTHLETLFLRALRAAASPADQSPRAHQPAPTSLLHRPGLPTRDAALTGSSPLADPPVGGYLHRVARGRSHGTAGSHHHGRGPRHRPGRRPSNWRGKGYRLMLIARSAAELEQTHQLAGNRPWSLPADVTDPQQAGRIIAATIEQYGRVDALINSAGVAPQISIEQMTPEAVARRHRHQSLGRVLPVPGHLAGLLAGRTAASW